MIAVASGPAALHSRVRRWIVRSVVRTVAAVGALVTAAVGLTACLQVEQVVDVQDTDRVAVQLVAEPERNFGIRDRPAVDVDAISAAVQRTLGADSAAVIDTRGGDGLRVRLETRPERLAEPVVLPGLGVVRLFERFEVTRSGDDWAVDAVALPPSIAFRPLDSLDGLSGAARNELGDVGVELQIRLPGQISGSNADDVDGEVATWRIDGRADAAPRPILARSVPADPLHPAVLAVGVALIAIITGAIVTVRASELEARQSLRRLRALTMREAAARRDWSDVARGSASERGRGEHRRSRGSRRPARPSHVRATEVVHGGMYDLGDDDSVAIPVGGNAWGPPPPEPAGTATGARTEPARLTASPDDRMEPEPGWYPDPGGSEDDRFWDGSSWTAATRPGLKPGSTRSTDPSAAHEADHGA